MRCGFQIGDFGVIKTNCLSLKDRSSRIATRCFDYDGSCSIRERCHAPPIQRHEVAGIRLALSDRHRLFTFVGDVILVLLVRSRLCRSKRRLDQIGQRLNGLAGRDINGRKWRRRLFRRAARILSVRLMGNRPRDQMVSRRGFCHNECRSQKIGIAARYHFVGAGNLDAHRIQVNGTGCDPGRSSHPVRSNRSVGIRCHNP